jgi:hypothetical protein
MNHTGVGVSGAIPDGNAFWCVTSSKGLEPALTEAALTFRDQVAAVFDSSVSSRQNRRENRVNAGHRSQLLRNNTRNKYRRIFYATLVIYFIIVKYPD